MLDFFTILTKGGLVLWWFQDQYVQTVASDFAARINKLIHEAMLEGQNYYRDGDNALKYKLDNELDLVFVVGYNMMLKISYADKFLDAIQQAFREQYRNSLSKSNEQFFNSNYRTEQFAEFEKRFHELHAECRKSAKTGGSSMRTFQQSEKSQKTVNSLLKKKQPAEQAAAAQISKISANPDSVSNIVPNNNSVGNSDVTSSSDDKGEEDDEDEDGQDNDSGDANLAGPSAEERRAQFIKNQKLKNSSRNKKGNKNAKKGKDKTTWDDFSNSPKNNKKLKNQADMLDYSTPPPSAMTQKTTRHADDVNLKPGKYSK